MTSPQPVAPAIFTLNPNHPDVALATLSRYILAAFNDLADSTVSMDDLRLVVASLTQLSNDYIAALQASLADRRQLNDRVAALEARTLRGTTGTGTMSQLLGGNTNLTITLKTAMPSADYIALPVIDATTGVNLSTVTATVTAKTASTVTVRVANSGLALLQTVSITVIAIQLA